MANDMTLTNHDEVNEGSYVLLPSHQGDIDLVDLTYPSLTAIQAGLGPKFSELKRTGAVTLTAEHLFQMLQSAFDSGVSTAVEQHHNDDKHMRRQSTTQEEDSQVQEDQGKAAMEVDFSDHQEASLTQLRQVVQRKDQELEAQGTIIVELEAQVKAQSIEMARLRGKRAAYIVAEFGNRMFR